MIYRGVKKLCFIVSFCKLANNFYSESQSDLCYSRGPGREHVAWVLVTLGKSAALLRKVQEMCSAQELTSDSAQRPGGSSGGSGEPLLESRPRSGADPSEAEKRRRSAELGVTYINLTLLMTTCPVVSIKFIRTLRYHVVYDCYNIFLVKVTSCKLVETLFRDIQCESRATRQRLVLMLKPSKPAFEPSSYRPLCMLDTVGKLLERIIANRLEAFTEGPAGLTDSQFGFRKGRSTIDAIQKVLSIAKAAISGKRYHRGTKKYCVIVTLDVKNAFNSARLNHILSALEKMGVPPYLRRIIASYFSDRVLEYSTDDSVETYSVTASVPQGSVFGTILWNAMYNKILGLRLPRTVSIVGFADNIALTIVDKNWKISRRTQTTQSGLCVGP
ncbi:unnamed protein product [Trichogramma brassicae]|uniref:Reverse transcriptase domain-containing protein n=1 Tax=Trichogramma brassicae TaxID=86971 RepID=A0A6H5J0S3_9HYME|nr:unnamed protein product [Trichogramma brassicae]